AAPARADVITTVIKEYTGGGRPRPLGDLPGGLVFRGRDAQRHPLVEPQVQLVHLRGRGPGAFGAIFIFDRPYTGTPGELDFNTPGVLAHGLSNGIEYDLGDFALQGGQT